MKYLKSYSMLESNNFVVDLKDWEDFKDLVRSEILDEWNISDDLVKESIPGRNGNSLLEPELHFGINDRFNNDEPVEIIKACRDLHNQVYQMTGLYIHVSWSSQQVNIILCDIPNNYTIIRDFNLQEVESDNIVDRKSGGVCNLETAIEIIKYLNKFYSFCYESDINLFKECFNIMSKKGDCKIVFSLSKFLKERYSQKLSFKLCLNNDWNGKYPIFLIDSNHVDSPLIRLRYGNHSWDEISGNQKIINFIKGF
jgi:hypothetical protein